MKPMFFVLAAAASLACATPIHVTYLWHMHQPIYFPYETVQQTYSNNRFSFNLYDVFNTRSGPYQTWPKNAVQQGADKNMPHAGAQVSFSGSLGENLNNLWGPAHSSGWDDAYDYARNTLRTSLNNPRLDLVGFAYHHSLMPLTSPDAMRMQIKLHKDIYSYLWDSGGGYSKGFFPPECAFAPRMIPALVQEGIEWVLVDNIHLDRACVNYEQNIWSSGGSVLRPNRADAINPDPGTWVQLNNVWAPTKVSAPWGYQPHYVQYVDPWSDPAAPAVYRIIAVPAARYEGNENGRGGYGAFKPENVWGSLISHNNDSNHPMIMVCHSDGDNYGMLNADAYHAQHGNFLEMCKSNPDFDNTTVQDYLQMYPPRTTDVIHVENGSWAGADAGDPEFKKWNGDTDGSGLNPDRFSWSVLIAMQNRVAHANAREAYSSTADIRSGGGNDSAKAWHYYLVAETSCYWYWDGDWSSPWNGNATRACNLAAPFADAVINRHPGVDTTPPSIFPLQRSPYNPGGKHWDESTPQPSDFQVWTFVYDVSGLASVELFWRTDKDGVNPVSSYQNELYADGTEVHPWTALAMSPSWDPATKGGDVVPDPSYRAQAYKATVAGQTNVLIDYFVQAIDTAGNTNRSDICHVYVGMYAGGGGGDTVVSYAPDPPVRGAHCTISYNSAGRVLAGASQVNIHFGYNNWSGGSLGTYPMTGTVGAVWARTIFISNAWTQIDCVFNNGAGTWDNNSGQDWHQATIAADAPPVASFSATPRSGAAPLTVTFSDTSSGVVSWRHWDFGNGDSSSAQSPSVVYATAGIYSVALIVSNAYGASTNTQGNYITVTQPGPPLANFSAAPRHTTPGSVIQFTDQSSGSITAYQWHFGDISTSALQNPQHAYMSPGVYDIALIVSGPGGASTNIKSGYITVDLPGDTHVDGTNIPADFAGAPFMLQDTPTGAGDAATPASGSELDALYMTNTLTALHVGITGNIATNGECLMILIDSVPGGINQFSNSQSHACERLRSMAGVKLETGFNPDYALVINASGAGYFIDFENLTGSAGDGYLGSGAGSIFISSTMTHGATGFSTGFNNSNTGGVTTTSVANAASVSTGWEFLIPWEMIGIEPPAQGTLKVQALMAGQMWEGPAQAATRRLTNQSLPGVQNDNRIQGPLGN